MPDYQRHIGLLKAISDANRLMIVDMLSCGEICACRILEKLAITQPTLSHHMKVLCDCGLVIGRKEGKWTYYSLNEEKVRSFKVFFDRIASNEGISDYAGQLNDGLLTNCASCFCKMPNAECISNQGG